MGLDKARIALIALLAGAIAGSVLTRIFIKSDSFRLPELPEVSDV